MMDFNKKNVDETQEKNVINNNNSNIKINSATSKSKFGKVVNILLANKNSTIVLGIMIVFVVAIALLSIFSNDNVSYYGTWDIHSVNMEGSVFTISELEAMGDYSLSDFRIVIKEGGKAWIHSQGSGTTLDWENKKDGIKIGVRECSFENKLLSIENNGIIIYLSKTSDSQTVSKPETDNTHTHTGGVATCTEKAICSICNEQYGELNSANHSRTDYTYSVNANDNTKHDKKYSCCGIIVSTVAHSGGTATTTQKAKCEYCHASYGNVLSNNAHTHTGGVATCTEKAICGVCNEQYGELNSANHSSTVYTYSVNANDNTKHDKKYSCCGIIVSTVAHSGGTATTTQKAKCEYCNASYGEVLSSFNWQLAGNGCGARIPEPSFEYDVKASSTYLCVEVYNTTEEDFYDYVNECRTYGFNGTVGSATSPDLYYMVYDADEYYLEVFYYADEEYIYVYIRPPYNNSDDDHGNNDNNNDEITAEELLLAKTIAEDSNLSALETKESLISYGISEERAAQIVEMCDVKWHKQASHRAENLELLYDKVSPNRLTNLLYERGFTSDDISYAVNNCGIDWENQAFLYIEDCLSYEVRWGNRDIWYGPADIRMTLDEEGFEEDTIISVDSQIDWQEQVKLYIQHLSSFYPKFNRLDARDILNNGILANDEGVSIALETSGVDWKEHALNIASEFYEEKADSWYYEDQPLNAIFEDMKRELLEVWDFTDEEAKYAITKVKEIYNYSDESNNPTYSTGLEYTLSNDQTYYIVSGIGDCDDENIVIASEYNHLPVREIGSSAFYNCKDIISVKIPSTVINIGDNAFRYCTNLTEVLLGDNVISIEEYAFYSCNSLLSVILPDSVENVNDDAFAYCSSLSSITVGANIKSIGDNAFAGCFYLVEIINNSPLHFSKGLTSNGQIAYSAIEIHNKSSKISVVDNYIFYESESHDYLIGYIGDDESLVLPNNFKGNSYIINDYAFYDRYEIMEVVLSDCTLEIGDYAFGYCYNLAQISIPENVNKIGDRAFAECNLIINKENGVSYVGNWAIGFDQSVDKVVFRPNTVGIADAAFSQCNNIIKVELTNQIKTIGDHAFYSCDKLTDVVMSDSVLYIGRYAFSGCEKLQNIQLSRNLIYIGELAFHYCKNISTIHIPLSTLIIEENAFYNCSKLSISCEANLKPSEWSDSWNPHSRPVVWGVPRVN